MQVLRAGFWSSRVLRALIPDLPKDGLLAQAEDENDDRTIPKFSEFGR